MGTSVDARVSSQVLPASVDRVHQPAPAPRFSRTPSAPPEPACAADDPVAVLGDWGVPADEVTALVRTGVIG
jgi:alpha-methylacyl-CoA racemase